MEKTRWLTAREQSAWRAYLKATQALFERIDRQLREDSAMSHADYAILVRLSESEGRMLRMSQLACLTLFSPSRLSHAVSRLEEVGWVRRESCPTDRRGSYAVLTDRGLRALEAAAPGHVATVRENVFDRLSPQQVEQLTAIATAIAEADGQREGD
jgi:DNA-binding MarR family transcriptional regulator